MSKLTLLLCIVSCLAGNVSAADHGKRIAITIDDVPLASAVDWTMEETAAVNERILSILQRHGVEAVGFVNEDKVYRKGQLDAGVAILERWLDAGMELGNHNYGHIGLWNSTLAANEDAVIKGEVITRRLTDERKRPLRFYRHPFTQTGRDEEEKHAFEAFLSSRGYTVAPFTIEHDDYLFSCVYDKTLRDGTDADRQTIVREYLAHLDAAVDTYESMSEQIFGRQIPQILLIHDNRLNSDTLGSTLSALKKRGYQFISLQEAMKDEAYRSPDPASRQFGPSWLTRWAKQRGLKLTVYGHPDPEGWVAEKARSICAN